MRKLIEKFSLVLLCSLPVVIFFSFRPVIVLGESDNLNLELTLPLLWLAFFSVLALANLPQFFRKFSLKQLFLSLIFPLFAHISLLWTSNLLRGLLTVAVIWMLYFSAVYLIYLCRTLKNNHKRALIHIFLTTAVVVSVVCWVQCILDIFGLPTPQTLLCDGCTYRIIGFPHPNGFAIEPQFMGNLLIAPALLCLNQLVSYRYTTKKQRRNLEFLLAFFSATIFLTFSRGAIYSFVVGVVALALVHRHTLKTHLLTLLIIPLSFTVALTAQGLFAQFSPTSDTFYSGLAKSIHHLSLGVIDFRPASALVPAPVSTASTNTSQFSGYIAESTDIRLDVDKAALKIWTSSPQNFLFGAGLGSSGVELNRLSPAQFPSIKNTIQNEYLTVLVELGLFGAVSAMILLILCIKRHNLPLLIAFLSSIMFFSGLTNALHIYLLLALSREDFTKPRVRRSGRK